MLIFEKFVALFTEEPLCPEFGVKCRKHRCHAYGERKGLGNDGNPTTEMACSIIGAPLQVQIENIMATRSLAAAVETWRNTHVKNHAEGMVMIASAIQKSFSQLQLVEVPDEPNPIRNTDDRLQDGGEICGNEGDRGGNGQSHDNELSETGQQLA